jgi:hypothetical protein
MPPRRLLVLCVLLVLLAGSGRAFASEPTPAEGYHGPQQQEQAPEPRLRPEYVGGYNPYASRLRFGVPTFNWGHFGARSHPTCSRHFGYYARYVQWRFYPGSLSRY